MQETIVDIKPIMNAPVNWLLVAGIAVAVIAVAFSVWWFLLRRKPVPVVPLWETALARLQDLHKATVSTQQDQYRFYGELSDLIRWYTQARFNIDAVGMSTQELDEAKTTVDCDQTQMGTMLKILQRADMIKFAKGEGAAGQARMDMAAVEQFIETTKPVVKPDGV